MQDIIATYTAPMQQAIEEQHQRTINLETQLANIAVPRENGRDLSDPAYRRVAFLNFPSAASTDQRIQCMRAFMSQHFPAIVPVHVNLFPDKDGAPSVHGFVELVDENYVRKITNESKSRNLQLQGLNGVRIKPAKSRIDMNRDWALRRADEVIREHVGASGKVVTKERGSADKVRGVYVNGVRVFEQPGRYTRDGVFLHEYISLRLR